MNKISFVVLVIVCSFGVRAQADTLAITYSLAGALTGPPAMTGTTLTFDSLSTVSVLSGNPSLNAIWNPVTSRDLNVIDLTKGVNNATFSWTFADGNTLSGKLLEDVSKLDATGTGPFTQIFTFTGGTANLPAVPDRFRAQVWEQQADLRHRGVEQSTLRRFPNRHRRRYSWAGWPLHLPRFVGRR